jgi:LacI family transcriptional regulator
MIIQSGKWELSAGYKQTFALMRMPHKPTAIFCANDLIALGCYDALKELGRRIPQDVAVIDCEDREIAQSRIRH